MKDPIKVVVTGDSFITKRLPRNECVLEDIRKNLIKYDVTFTNFEITVHNFDKSPSATSGGTWAATRPFVLQDLKWLGFNMMACANNHSLDWLHEGLLSTIQYLEKDDWVYAGIGRNLFEASQPKYLETQNGTVALLSVTSTFENWHQAGQQRPDVPGRPGVNPLRHKTIHRIPKEELKTLKEIANNLEINNMRNINVKEGFLQDYEDSFVFGQLQFEEGESATSTFMDPVDGKRIAKSIQEASRQADAVLVSVHSHEMKAEYKHKPADFLREFGKFCIDNGAHAVIGHGPHILRGVEIYNKCPIFYSLGNFIFQNETVERQPSEFYDLYQLDHSSLPADGFDARSKNGTKGLAANPKVYESVIASFEMNQGMISSIEFTPITLGFEENRAKKGKPRFANKEQSERILRDLNELSSEFGTVIKIKDGKGFIAL